MLMFTEFLHGIGKLVINDRAVLSNEITKAQQRGVMSYFTGVKYLL